MAHKHWVGPFYPTDLPAKGMLSWYVRQFDTVELNNSFYHLPKPETFEAWKRATPPSFCFAVKGSRYITHRKKLNDPETAVARFLEPVQVLGDKLGPILSIAATVVVQPPASQRLSRIAAPDPPLYLRISRSQLA